MSNVFQMYAGNGWKAGFWVRRENWVNTVAFVKLVGGMEFGELPGIAPYFSQIGKGSPKVVCDVFDATTGEPMDQNTELRCPGTYTYRLIECPLWAK